MKRITSVYIFVLLLPFIINIEKEEQKNFNNHIGAHESELFREKERKCGANALIRSVNNFEGVEKSFLGVDFTVIRN